MNPSRWMYYEGCRLCSLFSTGRFAREPVLRGTANSTFELPKAHFIL